MTTRNLTCAEVDERLGDYLEGALDDASVADLELHLSGCTACAALVRDFERITRDAATLAPLPPAHDLWPAIARRLDASSMADLGARAAAKRDTQAARDGHGAPHRRTAWHRVRLGALAAGLVGITAISTYYLTSRSQSADVARTSAASGTGGPSSSALPGTDSALSSPDAALESSATSQLASSPGSPSDAVAPAATVMTRVNRGARLPARATYDAEISSLRGVLSQRREQLDPRTVAVLESSIATIDSAIADARRALEVDPASRFLSTQLNKALEKKLGLLRTAALLPSRT